MERQITSPPRKIKLINDVLVGGSESYLIGLKWDFRFEFWEFFSAWDAKDNLTRGKI